MIKFINFLIRTWKYFGGSAKGVSDGYHTFDELYEFRKEYNVALFNEWANAKKMGPNGRLITEIKYDVHKSLRHNDGEECFGGNSFKVSAMLPTGEISNHYRLKDWDRFNIPEAPNSKYTYDGHTGKDVLKRLQAL